MNDGLQVHRRCLRDTTQFGVNLEEFIERAIRSNRLVAFCNTVSQTTVVYGIGDHQSMAATLRKLLARMP